MLTLTASPGGTVAEATEDELDLRAILEEGASFLLRKTSKIMNTITENPIR